MSAPPAPLITAIITTRNRREQLRRTLTRLFELHPLPDEILVCADGCTDGTFEMVRKEFPTCILLENEIARGSIYSRNRLIRAARSDLVASFDDDSYPVDVDFFGRVKILFGERSDIAVMSFPELRDDGNFANPAKSRTSPPHLVSAYANCAAVMRRSVYTEVGGYPVFFRHAYEEPDYALKCYGAGYIVCFYPGLTVRHHESPKNRNRFKTHQLNARNELWSVWLRCPWPWLPVVSLYRIWRQFSYACSEGLTWAVREPLWWFSALSGIGACLEARQPIPWRIYYGWMRLARNPRSL